VPGRGIVRIFMHQSGHTQALIVTSPPPGHEHTHAYTHTLRIHTLRIHAVCPSVLEATAKQ
jgi:hypothetical protein